MKHLFRIGICLLFLNCGTPPQKNKNVIGNDPIEETEVEDEVEVVPIKPVLPKGAVTANYEAGNVPFYAFVEKIDKRNGLAIISFESDKAPTIKIPKTYGANLSMLRFPEFESDLLLVTAKIKDPVFNKYYLYQLKNGQWSMVVNSFAIHKDNMSDTLVPIRVDPENPNYMLRYYSVFDLDETSDLGYTWRLLSERIPIND